MLTLYRIHVYMIETPYYHQIIYTSKYTKLFVGCRSVHVLPAAFGLAQVKTCIGVDVLWRTKRKRVKHEPPTSGPRGTCHGVVCFA